MSGVSMTLVHGKESKFDQDRKAILALAGEYEVDFLFLETMSLSNNYKKKEKIYREDALEKVFIVRNEDRLIELQHILVAHETVVKHWSQIWTFEDKDIVRYQSGSSWKVEQLEENTVKGTWSQLVTQTDDSARYESFGKWVHNNDISIWEGDETRRPLPRREYKKRSDYDYLVSINRQTVTSTGWFHEQDNIKQVDRDGKRHYLAREVGFNKYTKVTGVDFADVDEYWDQYKDFWINVKGFWRGVELNSALTIKSKVGESSRREVFEELMESVEKGEKVEASAVQQKISPFVAVTEKK